MTLLSVFGHLALTDFPYPSIFRVLLNHSSVQTMSFPHPTVFQSFILKGSQGKSIKIVCLVHSDINGHFQGNNKQRSLIYSVLQEFPAALFSCLLDAFFLILHPKG